MRKLLDLEASVLVFNAGSSSLKVQLIQGSGQGSDPKPLQKLWNAESHWLPTQPGAVRALLDNWLAPEMNNLEQPITLAGHRVVHGGERFTEATLLDEATLVELSDCIDLAPLHNGPALQVMHWLRQKEPQIEQWACFDTAFHNTLPAAQRTYALPKAWRAQGLRRYGFHGLNHQHVSETVSAICAEEGSDESELAQLRLISCHLGAGCSLCAIAGGRSIATTMGFTPLEGLVMATRSGSVDPGLLLHVLGQGVSSIELEQALNHHSGLLGLSGLSGDMRVLRQAAAEGHDGAQLAIAVFTARLLEGIGAMTAALGGVDVIALTGGIGQNDETLAHTLHAKLAWLGPFRLLQIPANEEEQIARQCWAARGRGLSA